jgi:transposase
MGQVHEVYYSDKEDRREFKQLVQHYDDLTREAAGLKVKIKARYRRQGVIVRGVSVYDLRGRNAWLATVESKVAKQIIIQLYKLMDKVEQTKDQARKLLKQKASKYKEIKLFEDVPGMGLIGSCRFSAYVQTPDRFSSKRKLWRYSKLGITNRSSDGKSLGRQALDYNGNGRLKDVTRKAFEAASKTKADNAFKRFYKESLKRTHDKTHARLNTQRKIVSVLRAMWKTGEKYVDTKG